MIFLNTCIQSKSSIKESNDLATNVSLPGFLVGEDALVGGDDEVAELPGGEDTVGPLLEVGEGEVVAGGDDSTLVDAADEFHHNLLGPVVIDDLELPDVAVHLHQLEEPDDHLGRRPDEHLFLALPLGVDDGP